MPQPELATASAADTHVETCLAQICEEIELLQLVSVAPETIWQEPVTRQLCIRR